MPRLEAVQKRRRTEVGGGHGWEVGGDSGSSGGGNNGLRFVQEMTAAASNIGIGCWTTGPARGGPHRGRVMARTAPPLFSQVAPAYLVLSHSHADQNLALPLSLPGLQRHNRA